MMSVYGMIRESGSMKNCEMNGALRFMLNTLLWSLACLATFNIDSGLTVMKKP